MNPMEPVHYVLIDDEGNVVGSGVAPLICIQEMIETDRRIRVIDPPTSTPPLPQE